MMPPVTLTSASELVLCLPTAQSGAPEEDRPGCSTLPLGPDLRIGPSTGIPAAQWVLKWMKSTWTAAFQCPLMGADQQIRMGLEGVWSSSWAESCFCPLLGAEKQNGVSSGSVWSSTEHRCNLQWITGQGCNLLSSAPWSCSSYYSMIGLPIPQCVTPVDDRLDLSTLMSAPADRQIGASPGVPGGQWGLPVDEKPDCCMILSTRKC